MLLYLLTSGLTSGALYAMVAIGLVVVYGELFMMGGFFAYIMITLLGFPYLLSMVLAVVLSFLLGVLSDRAVYRPLMKAPGTTIVLATVGTIFVRRRSKGS